jgi:hypothetical protein
MSRPYAPEPHTHYDGNDPHSYNMHDVLDPPELNTLVDQLERENKLYVNGVQYFMCEHTAPNDEGVIYARLRPVDRPF